MDLYTVDSGGITRNIGRDTGTKTHTAVLKEARTKRDWVWFCSALWRRKDEYEYQYDNALPINLVDTVLLEGGKPTTWYFTGADGIISKKAGANVNMIKVLKSFTNQATRFGCEFAAVLRYDNHFEVIAVDQLSQYRTGFPYGGVCLQTFIPPKGTSIPLSSDYEVEYKLDVDNSQICVVSKLGNVIGLMDTKNAQVKREKIRCCEGDTIRTLEENTKDIIMTVEKSKNVKIISSTLQFVISDDRTAWLVTADNIITTRTRPGISSSNYTQAKSKTKDTRSKLDKVRDEQYSSSLLPEQPDLLLLNSRGKAKLREIDGYHGPTHMQKRFGTEKGRNFRERTMYLSPSNTNNLYSSRKSGINTNERMTRSMTTLPSIRPNTSDSVNFDTSPIDTRKERRRDHPERATTAAAIGSSQLSGCNGDFCEIPIESYTKHESGLLGELGDSYNNSGDNNMYKINYKWIIQAREEKELVKNMIHRLENNNEEGDYCSYDIFGKTNLDLDRVYPAQYYKDVEVCANCYKLYTKIQEERQKCINKYQKITPEEKRELELAESYKELQTAKLDLTKNDIFEFRRFTHPPQAVSMTSTALMILLTGNTYNWNEIRKLISNSDRLLSIILLFDPDTVEAKRMYDLKPYLLSPFFKPEIVQSAARSAGKFCKFVIDNSRYISMRLGIYHEVFPVEKDKDNNGRIEEEEENDEELPLTTNKSSYYHNTNTKGSSYTELPPIDTYDSNRNNNNNLSFADKVKMKRKQNPVIPPPADPEIVKKARQRELSPKGIAFGTTTDLLPEDQEKFVSPVESPNTSPKRRTSSMAEYKHMQMMKSEGINPSPIPKIKKPQSKGESKKDRLARLANPPGTSYINKDGVKTTKITEETSKFICEDGITSIPYQVMGEADEELQVPSLIVINDFFDTFERNQIMLSPLLDNYGCQILFFNYPGQAETRIGAINNGNGNSSSQLPKINNKFVANILNQLLHYLNQTCEFVTDRRPFMICGIGNGANIASLFISTYCEEDDSYRNTLRSFIVINGFSYLDPQLTAILHSSINVISSFPANRHDLPVSYLSRFLFSSEYLKKVNASLALQLYTAVTNPITNNGRVQICDGTLNSVDVRPLLPSIECPIIAIQSTDDALINPSHLDCFIEGRSVHHVWSHESTDKSVINESNHRKLTVYQHTPNTAFIVWLKAGHEVMQECKDQVLQVFQSIYNEAKDAVDEDELPPVTEEGDEKFNETMEEQKEKNNEEAQKIRDEIRKENPPLTSDDVFQMSQRNKKTKELRELDEHLRKIQETQAQRRKKWEKEDKKVLEDLNKQLKIAKNNLENEIEVEENKLRILQLEARIAEERSKKAQRESEAARDSAELAVSALRAILNNSKMEEVQPLADVQKFEAEHKEQIPSSALPTAYLANAEQKLENDRIPTITQEHYDNVVNNLENDEQKKNYIDRKTRNVITLQRWVRGCLCRKRIHRSKRNEELLKKQNESIVKIQAMSRGYLARNRTKILAKNEEYERVKNEAVLIIERIIRGFLGRRRAKKFRQAKAALLIERFYRGHLGRLRVKEIRRKKAMLENENYCATKIQTQFRTYSAQKNYRQMKTLKVAAITIERVYRGHRGRLRANRIRKWQSAAPGPERLKLGLQMIEETKEAFERQRQEIDALHRAQEKAELKVSEIHSNLKESEAELVELESELKDIDKLENEVEEISHEQVLLKKKVQQSGGTVKGVKNKLSPEDQAKEHDLAVALDFKKAERDRKKKALEAEFAGIFSEIGKKKEYLETFEAKIADMESNRQRKEREFKRLQRNLMELLAEQKRELDNIREKGIELEVATAQSAAAASATATKAKEHEKKTEAIFNNTEELMKFQFMSMGLTYFSAMNMLQGLRDINSDTTSSAISASAETAVAAAAAAAAANIPTMKKLDLGADELLSAVEEKEKMKALERKKQLEEEKNHQEEPFPTDINAWTVDDVSRWLKTLSLGQYIKAFREACVDGEFLMELTPDDLKDVLGVEHALHIKKILFAREKLRNLVPSARRLDSVKSSITGHFSMLNDTYQQQPSTKQSSRNSSANLSFRQNSNRPMNPTPPPDNEEEDDEDLDQEEKEERGEEGDNNDTHLLDSTALGNTNNDLVDTHNIDNNNNDLDNEENREGYDRDQVFNFCSHGRVKKVQEALDHGFDVNTVDVNGNTLLIIACQEVLKPMVEFLISRKCDVDFKNRQGNTALHFAMTNDPTGTLGQLLMDAGASDMIENNYGLTPYDGIEPGK